MEIKNKGLLVIAVNLLTILTKGAHLVAFVSFWAFASAVPQAVHTEIVSPGVFSAEVTVDSSASVGRVQVHLEPLLFHGEGGCHFDARVPGFRFFVTRLNPKPDNLEPRWQSMQVTILTRIRTKTPSRLTPTQILRLLSISRDPRPAPLLRPTNNHLHRKRRRPTSSSSSSTMDPRSRTCRDPLPLKRPCALVPIPCKL